MHRLRIIDLPDSVIANMKIMTNTNEKVPVSGTVIVGPDQQKTRVLVVDRERLFRHCLMLLFSQEPDFHVIGEAQDGEEAVIMATGTRPDMIIMEADLPGLSGPKAAGLIRERLPETKVLMLSMQKNEKLIRESFTSGAIG